MLNPAKSEQVRLGAGDQVLVLGPRIAKAEATTQTVELAGEESGALSPA